MSGGGGAGTAWRRTIFPGLGSRDRADLGKVENNEDFDEYFDHCKDSRMHLFNTLRGCVNYISVERERPHIRVHVHGSLKSVIVL